jgi:hypothetical protein
MSQLPEISDEFMREHIGAARTYTLMLLKRTPRLASADARPTVWEHGRRNFAMREAGLLPIVCPVLDDGGWAGIGIFNASIEEVTRLMDADPGVTAGLFEYELHPVRGFPGSTLPG